MKNTKGDDLIEQLNELAAARKARHTGAVKLSRRLTKLSGTALDALEEVLTDSSVKAADRISAVKLTFDLLSKQSSADADNSGLIRIVFDGIEKELVE